MISYIEPWGVTDDTTSACIVLIGFMSLQKKEALELFLLIISTSIMFWVLNFSATKGLERGNLSCYPLSLQFSGGGQEFSLPPASLCLCLGESRGVGSEGSLQGA